MSLFDKTTDALGATLNFRLQKENLINSNIANAETPGYHAKKMDFEDQLARALDLDGLRHIDSNNPGHFGADQTKISKITADVYDNPDIPVNNDKNTVDLEKEMSSLAENTIMYKAAVELINKKLGAVKYALQDGGR